jgi:hypothetical protein
MANLQVVTVETKDGSFYKFPDVDMPDFKLMFGARGNTETLTLVNASNALLMLPIRIIKEVRATDASSFGEEVLWTSSSV